MDRLIIVRHERGKKFFVIQAAPQQVFIMFITDIIHDFTFYLYFSSSSPDAALQSAHLPLLLHSSSHNFPAIGEHHSPAAGRQVHAVHDYHHQTLPRPHLMLYLTFKPKDQHSNHRKSSSNIFSLRGVRTRVLFKPTRVSYASKASRASPLLALPLNIAQKKKIYLDSVFLTAAFSLYSHLINKTGKFTTQAQNNQV